jgi:hypothetical protein
MTRSRITREQPYGEVRRLRAYHDAVDFWRVLPAPGIITTAAEATLRTEERDPTPNASSIPRPRSMVDVIGYLHLQGLFVSYMSGNSTQLAAALGQGNLAEVGAIAKLVVLFVLGATAGQVLGGFTGEWHMSWVLAGVTVLLTIAALWATAPEPMALPWAL